MPELPEVETVRRGLAPVLEGRVLARVIGLFSGRGYNIESLTVSEITDDRPGESIAWRSTEDSDVDHEGWIAFRDNAFGRGTEVRVLISYDPPAGAVGKLVAKVMQREPRVQARRELRRFKQLMETGEISTSKAPDAAPRADRHF